MFAKKNQKITVKIHGTGSHGEGVGSLDGYTVFVEGALSGEVVEAELQVQNKRYGRASLLSILEPSPDRVAPPCPLFGKCGGCQIMHLSYEKQLQMKRQRVVDAFERIGKITGVDISPCSPSPTPLGYRNKIQLPVRQGENGVKVGLFMASSHDLVEVEHCHIHCPVGESVYQNILKLLKNMGIKGYDPKTGAGELRHILIKSAFSTGEVLVIFITTGVPSKELSQLAKQLIEHCPEVKGVIHNKNTRQDNVILGKPFTVLEGKGVIEENLCGLSFQVSPSSFFQVNPKQAEQLYQKVLEIANCKGDETVVDAYCGVGTLALIFANHVKRVVGIECVLPAIEDARDNARRNGISNARFTHGLAEKILPGMDYIDIVLLNPPRKGCDSVLINALAKQKPKTIVYISCNPATLARDLALLQTFGYAIDLVQPFDMFPQTAHVETLVKLKNS